MIAVSCILKSRTISSNAIGVQEETITEKEIPIIRTEDIYANEFYQANEQGYRPTLRIRISSLNYNGENELEYLGTTYTVIRIQNPKADETILICERKIKNA